MSPSFLQKILIPSVIFIFYFISLPTSVTLEDDGLFLLSSYFNGVSHPPGYPLHSLFGYFVTHLSFGNPALNGHALSAFFSALAGLVIFHIVLILASNIKNKHFIAYTAVVAFTLSSGVWSQSIITEVYTLNIFLFLLFLLLALHLDIKLLSTSSDKSLKKYPLQLLLIAFIVGLGLANHWPLFILGSIGIVYLLLKHIKLLGKNTHYILLGLALGLTPYILLYFNSLGDSIIKFHGEINTWSEFFAYVSRQTYNVTIDFSQTANYEDKLRFLVFTLKQLLSQWGIVNSLFVPIGIYAVLFSSSYNHNKRQFNAILISYISTSLLLVLILNYNYTVRFQSNLQPFLVLAHSLGAIFFAFGLNFFVYKIKQKTNLKFTYILLPLLLAYTLTINGVKNYRHNYTWAMIYAKQVLDSLEPNSILLVSGDEASGTIGYLHLIKGYRPDITLIEEGGEIIFHNRLFDPRKIPLNERRKEVIKFITKSKKSVYLIHNLLNINSEDHWLTYKYNKSIPNLKARLEPLNLLTINYLNYVFSDIKHTDSWTLQHRTKLRKRAVGHLILMTEQTENENIRNLYINYLLKTTSNLDELTHTLSMLSFFNKSHLLGGEKILIDKGWGYFAKENNRSIKSLFLNLIARLNYEKGRYSKSLDYYNKSINIWPAKSNKAYEKRDAITKNNLTLIEYLK